jgi:HAE1 family hydrophobic/amphiphilic exporter-1
MISRFFIERPIFANVIAVVTMIIGLICLARLPVAQYPQIVPPTIQVSTRYPGANAEVVAATVGVPLEQAVNGVDNALYMSSTSSNDGSYTLTVTFDVGTDLNSSLALVQNQVNSALAQLPGNVTQQGVTVKKVSTNILLVVSLYSKDARFDGSFLSNYAIINMQYPLARLPGVGQGCRQRRPEPERAGGGGATRRAPGAVGSGPPVHHRRPRSAVHGESI